MALATHLLLTLFLLCLLTFVIIAVHEAGHLLAGILVGFRWEALKIGPFLLEKDEKGKWRLSHSEGYGHGFVKMMPRNGPGTRFQWAVFLLAGCAANLLLSALIFLFLLPLSIGQQQALGWLGYVGFSSAFAAVNLLPFRVGRLSSDGLHLWRLCLNPQGMREYQAQWEQYRDTTERHRLAAARYQAATARHEAIGTFTDALKAGRRPRDWDAALVSQATMERDGMRNEALAAYYGYLWAVDTGDWAAAGGFIDRALSVEFLETDIKQRLVMEKAFWLARHRRDAAGARGWLAKAEMDHPGTPSFWRVQAAISLAEGDGARVAESMQKACGRP